MQLTSPPAISGLHSPTPLQGRAVQLEAVFLSEMLAHAGLDQGLIPGSAEADPDPFASFLRERLADQVARSGGIGLSEAIFRSLATEAGDEILG